MHTSMGEGQRGRETQSIPGRLRTVRAEPRVGLNVGLDVGLDPTTHEITTRTKIKNQMVNQLSHPGTATG